MTYYFFRDPSLRYEELYALESVCFPEDYFTAVQFQDMAKGAYWTARKGDVLAGFMSAAPRDGRMHVIHLEVSPDFRRRGIATALLDKAKKYAVENGFAHLSLNVLDGNAPARKLYEKTGFSLTGHRQCRYSVPAREIPQAETAPAVAREEGDYKYACRFLQSGAEIGSGKYNEELGGCKDLILAEPEKNLPGVLNALGQLLRPTQDTLYIMSADVKTIAACEKARLSLWSVIWEEVMPL